MKTIYKGRFFYQIYFHQEGVAEALSSSCAKMYFAASSDTPLNKWLEPRPANAKLLDGLSTRTPIRAWMTRTTLRSTSMPWTGRLPRPDQNRAQVP